jgi:hypothetical protein
VQDFQPGRRHPPPGAEVPRRNTQHESLFNPKPTPIAAVRPGIRQFLDIGTGIPTTNNTHEVTQDVQPGCRVVYVDNDPS